MTRGIHTKPNQGESQSWITPKPIIDALGPFDLDPCACSEMPWRTAKKMISPPDDGLASKWKGRVWLNPPYAENASWLTELVEHGRGTALLAARTEVERWFFPFVWEKADAVLFIRGRLTYHKPDGTPGKGNAGHGSVLAAYGAVDVQKLLESEIEGQFISLMGRGR